MEKLVSRIWGNVVAGVNFMCLNDKSLNHKDLQTQEPIFENEFMALYRKIVSNYMLEGTETLDRHKVAAIIMCSVIKSDLLEAEQGGHASKIFLGNYILATDCGFAYLLKELNMKLNECNIMEIKKFFFPKALACETIYYRIFYRNLYFADNSEDWHLNPLDIAERLFLLEYMTLEKSGIDPNILKEY